MIEGVHQFFQLFIYKTDASLNKSKVKRLAKLICGPILGLSALLVLIFGLPGVDTSSIALASHPGGLEISIRGTSLFFMDSNGFCSTSANLQGPDGLWLPVVVTNTTTDETYTGLEMTFTPPLSTTADDPIRYLGNLGPGESISVFYFVDYSQLRDHPDCDNGIDGWYSEPYTLSITSVNGSLSAPATFVDTFDSVSLISANAGGLLISDAMGPGGAVGQVITQAVVYKFGNNPANSQLFLQPAGNGDFNDQCFRLVGSQITSSEVDGVITGTEDTLYFPATDTANPDTIGVTYEWLILCSPGEPSQLYPWAEITSGTQPKYNQNGFVPADNPLPEPITDVVDITKSVTPQILPTGGTVTYTIEFANSYTQAVYLTRITDTLDPGIQYGGMVTALSDILPSNSTVSPTLGATGTLVWYGIPFPHDDVSYRIPALSSIQLVYTATVTSTEGIYNNVASGIIGNSVVGPVDASVRVSLPPDLNVNKVSTGPVPFEPGDLITYTIIISNSGGDAFGVTVSDTIPLYTSFVANSVTITPPTAGGTTGSPPIIASGITVTKNSVVTITYNVIIDDPLPAGVDTITNTVAVTSTEVPTPTTDTITDPVVAAPVLNIVKDDGGITAQPGDTVVYTLVFSNTGNQAATNVVLTDTVPANTTFDATSSDPGWSCANGDPSGTVCTIIIGSVTAGTFDSVDFAVTIDDPLPAGVSQLSNTGFIGDDRTPNADKDSDTTPVVAAPILNVVKDDGGITAQPGDTVVYTLVFSNTGNQAATNVVLTDTVPANTTFDATSSDPGWSCANGDPSGTICTIIIGSVTAGTFDSVDFAVTIDDPLPAGVSQLSNTGSIGDDRTPNADNDSDTTPVVAAPILNIVKDDGGITAQPGDTVVYTLVFSNTGNQAATNVVLTDIVPANTTFDATGSDPGWSCTNGDPSGTVCTLLYGDLAAGAQDSVDFAVIIDDPLPAGITQLSNTGSIGDDRTPNADNDSDTTPVVAAPILNIVKDDGGITAQPGDTVVYTLVFSNTGNQAATNVVLTDTVPANTTFDAIGSDPGWSCVPDGTAGSVCTLLYGDLAAGAQDSVDFAVTIDDPLLTGITQLSNTGSIGDDRTPNADNDSDTTPVVAAPILNIVKDDGGITAKPGDTVVYTLVFSNTGNQAATNVVLTDTVPANTTFDATSSDPGWSCVPDGTAGSVCTLLYGDLAAGVQDSVDFAVTIDDPLLAGASQVFNTGSIGDDRTPNADNDSDTTPVVAAPILNIVKDDGGITAQPGDTVVYTLVFSNTGNQAATNVVLTDTVPANTTFDTASSDPGWSCVPDGTAGSVCTLTYGDLAAGAQDSVDFAVTIDDPLTGVSQLSNTGSIGDDRTPNADNDSDTTPVVAAPILNIVKDDGGITAQPGDTVVYTLVFSNTGNQAATNVVLTDTVPANTTFDATSSDPGWSCVPDGTAGSVCTLTYGDLAAGAQDSVDFAVTIDDPLTGVSQVFNTGFIGDDRTPNADNDSDTTPILNPNIAVTKDVIFSPTVPFAIVTYTINITNTGQVTLDPVTLTDKLPAGLAFVKGTGNPADPPIVSSNGLDLTWNNLGLLDPQQSIQISFNAQVVTETTGTYINVATAIGKHPGGTVTDNDDAPIFVTDPAVQIEKNVVPPGVVDGVITFTIKLTNVGPSPLGFVPLVDTFTGPIEYIGGTPPADDTSTPGVLRWTDLVATFGGSPLAPNAAFVLTTAFRLTTVATEFTITNTAVVSEARDIYNNQANRDEDLKALANVPTYVDLLYFEVNQQGGQFVLNWATAVEIDNFGFRLLRSRTGQLADAVEIGFVSGQGYGTASGQSYTFVDKNVIQGQTYTYWLVDIDFSGQETVHGPETLKLSGSSGSRETTIYLPLIIK